MVNRRLTARVKSSLSGLGTGKGSDLAAEGHIGEFRGPIAELLGEAAAGMGGGGDGRRPIAVAGPACGDAGGAEGVEETILGVAGSHQNQAGAAQLEDRRAHV